MFLELKSLVNPVDRFLPGVSLSIAVDSAVSVVWNPGRLTRSQLSYRPVLHTGAFPSLPLAGLLWSFSTCFSLFLVVFLPFYAFAFFPLSNYNTAILWCFQEFFLGPPRIPKSRDKIFSCNLCMHCWMHVASSRHLTWCGCCRAPVELYCLGEDEKTGSGMFGPVSLVPVCIYNPELVGSADLELADGKTGHSYLETRGKNI